MSGRPARPAAAALVLALLLPALALAQGKAPGKGKKPSDPATRALEYVRKNIKASKSWARFAERVFAGFAFMAAGSTPAEGEYSADLNECIEYCVSGPFGSTQENWYLALVGLFLAECQKLWPDEAKATRLKRILKKIEENQEATGGWSHKKGFVYNLGRGRVPDLGIVTGLMIAALGNMKAAGMDVPVSVLQRALAYCRKNSDGVGLIYGTNNPVPDRGCTRGAGVLIGLYFMKQRNDLFGKIAGGLRSRVDQLETGHAFPPIHFFNSAVGNYVCGQYGTFRARWIRKLISMQEADGGIWLKNQEKIDYEKNQLKSNVIGTAVLATILLLDRNHLFQPAPRRKAKRPASARRTPPRRSGRSSPFGRNR